MTWRIKKLRLWLAYRLMPGDLRFIFADLIKQIIASPSEEKQVVIKTNNDLYEVYLDSEVMMKGRALK